MRKTRLWLALALGAILAIAGVAAGCGGDDDNGNGNGNGNGEPAAEADDLGLTQEGQLLVGTDAPFPPFEIGRPGDADFTGYDIELMDAIAEQIGVETEYVNASFDTIFRDVAQGQFDIVAAASTITEEREEVVDFSDPYYYAEQALLVTEGSDIASIDDLEGQSVGVQQGTTGQDFAEEDTDADPVRPFPDGPDAIAALATGQVDAVIIDLPVAEDAVEQQEGLEVVQAALSEEYYGFAMAPGNDALREAVNDALRTLKDDGTLTDLYQQYFEVDPPDAVLEDTHEPS